VHFGEDEHTNFDEDAEQANNFLYIFFTTALKMFVGLTPLWCTGRV